MSMAIPFSHNDYRVVPFDTYHLFLPGFYWVSAGLEYCYKFISFPAEPKETEKNKMLYIKSSSPSVIKFDEFSASRDEGMEALYLSLLNETFRVESLIARHSNGSAMILHLVASDGTPHYFYSTTKDPFNPVHKKMYGF